MADPLRLARAVQVVARGLGKVGRERARSGDLTPQQADAVELLEARGMVADDARQTDVRLTPKGKRSAEALATETARTFAEVLERVPRAERQRVIDGIDLLARAVTLSEGAA